MTRCVQRSLRLGSVLVMVAVAGGCGSESKPTSNEPANQREAGLTATAQSRLAKYATVRLAPDLSQLSVRDRYVVRLMVEAADIMNDLYWKQTYGDKHQLFHSVVDPELRKLLEINYGPWDRLAGDEPFIEGAGPKPLGANFYPHDMTAAEFEAAIQAAPEKATAFKNLYTLIRRNQAGQLVAVPYHRAFGQRLAEVAARLWIASFVTEDPELRRYLEARAKALVTDDYQPSDFAWMDMKNNLLDIVIGPIETYEDQLFGYKASFEGVVLLKDKLWSARLAKYGTYLPQLQQDLPVEPQYKAEKPGSDSDLNAYDVLFYAGDANAGAKSIAINLPNDEQVQLQRGSRRLQLKNVMQAKFDRILTPMTQILMAADQRSLVTFDAFFNNVMFHEVAHGLGIKNTLNGESVRMVLKDAASATEEGKADILGLFIINDLADKGLLDNPALEEKYTTFVASIFRSIRFGASNSHAKANVVAFNFFKEKGAVVRDDATGTYRVDVPKAQQATIELSSMLLHLQGNGDYDGAKRLMAEKGVIDPVLQADLDRVGAANIPVDIIFEQGLDVLGLGRIW